MSAQAPGRKTGGFGGIGGTGRLIGPLQATAYSSGLGKGLKEPVPPYRQAYVFGADLGTPNANSWNYMPELVDPTTVFDLSQITPNHEAVVALLLATDVPAGMQSLVEHKWYQDRDSQLLFDFRYTIADAGRSGFSGWAWVYIYSYIGYVPWEIYEDGAYHVDLTFSGPAQYSRTLPFTVKGVAIPPSISNFAIADFAKV